VLECTKLRKRVHRAQKRMNDTTWRTIHSGLVLIHAKCIPGDEAARLCHPTLHSHAHNHDDDDTHTHAHAHAHTHAHTHTCTHTQTHTHTARPLLRAHPHSVAHEPRQHAVCVHWGSVIDVELKETAAAVHAHSGGPHHSRHASHARAEGSVHSAACEPQQRQHETNTTNDDVDGARTHSQSQPRSSRGVHA
jgi:hypothetical protein